ncbi:MscL family protein [Streptomyces virginiae]|uniref:MscL family protein n=1 Tax=Streptomyces virginiae TaxID=1961 RepID=UPI0036F77C85
MVDLAVGIVIGAAFTAVVNGFVGAFLTPLVGLAIGATGDMSRKTFTLGATELPCSALLNAAIRFLLLACARSKGSMRAHWAPVNDTHQPTIR